MAYFEVFRGTQAQVDAQSIIDGQFLYTTDLGDNNKLYADVGSNRVGIGATYLTANKTVYVATTGSDTTGNGTSGNPYKTIAKGLSVIPKNLNGFNATLYIAGGTYSENVIAKGYGGGTLNIILQGNIVLASLTASTCDFVMISASTSANMTINNTSSNPIMIVESSTVRIAGSVSIVVNSAITLYGIFCGSLSTLSIDGTATVNNAGWALSTSQAIKVFIGTLTGTGNNTGILGDRGSVISYGTKTISATTEKSLSGGSIITNLITMP